jgi:hypothetical protein
MYKHNSSHACYMPCQSYRYLWSHILLSTSVPGLAINRQSSQKQRSDFLLFTTAASRPALGPTQPPNRRVRGSFPRVKRAKREADHSPPSSTEVINAWCYTFTPPYVFMVLYLVKHRDNYIFYALFLHSTVELLIWNMIISHAKCFVMKFWSQSVIRHNV